MKVSRCRCGQIWIGVSSIRKILFPFITLLLSTIGSIYPAHGAAVRHEIGALMSPLFGQLKAGGRNYNFYTALGGTVAYRYSITPRLLIEVGYEAQSSGTSLLLHGPDAGLSYSFFGRPSFSLAEEPLSLEVQYPFDVHVMLATWIREHDFSSFLPETAGIFTDTEDLAGKGSLLGGQAGLGIGFDLASSLRLVLRVRYLIGFTSAIEGGSVTGASVQCGLTARL
jgi:hypothetical protein